MVEISLKIFLLHWKTNKKGSLRDQNFENDVIMYAMIHVKMYIFVKGAENKRH